MESNVQRKIRAKVNMKKHLQQMQYLTLFTISENSFLTLRKGDTVFEKYKDHYYRISKKYRIRFKKNLFKIIKEHLLKNDTNCYLICEFSNDSGLLVLNSIKDFNEAFIFSNLDFYRVTLLSFDLEDEITFWDEGDNIVEIEIKGDKWSSLPLVSEE